jgi:DNA-binding CsgD family transcriptional regulator
MVPTSDIDSIGAGKLLDSLTDRQIAVMELAAQHKSNKVIAYELNISPSTVEQRMGYARDKLQTEDRNSTIRRFVELRMICGEPIYGITYLDPQNVDPQNSVHETEAGEFVQQPAFLEALDGKFGRWGRIGLIVAISMAIIFTALVMLAVANSLTELVG